MSHAPFACEGCAREGREVAECRIRIYQFSPYGKRCPREEPEKPRVIAEAGGDQYLEIPLELIYWKEPIRKDIREEDVNAMATSFTCHGQIQPIVIEGPDEEGKYEGVCGRLRYEAMKRFQGRPILARVHRFKKAREKREWQLAENLHRRELPAFAKADAYWELYESMRQEFGVYDKDIVGTIRKRQEELTGETQPEDVIYKYLQVSRLPDEVKKIGTRSKFSLRHGLQLVRLKDKPEQQLELAKKAAGEGWSSDKLKKVVDEIVSPPKEPEIVPECPVCGQRISKSKYLELRENVEGLLEEGDVEGLVRLFKEWVS